MKKVKKFDNNNKNMGRFQQGRGAGRGRGQRNTFNRFNKGRQSSSSNTPRKGLTDYIYTLGKQSVDYEIVTKFLILHIRKNFNNGDDIGNALDNLQEVQFTPPTLEMSSSEDKDVKLREDKQNDMIFEAKLAIFLKQEETYRTNKGKAYAFIFGQCSKIMQAKVMERKNYDKTTREPVALLQAIKELSYSYQDTKYDMKIVTGAIKNFVLLKQKDDESLIDYTTRFKTARDVMKAQLGADLTLHKVVMADPDYVKAETDEDVKNNKVITRKHYDRWQAYLYLENSDKNKYGSLINGLDSQQALGTNQYPTTLAKATEVLSNHRFDSAYMEQKKRKTRNNNNSDNTNQTKSQEGQESAPTPQLSFANIEGKCYCCGKPGHKSPQCRLRDKTERKDWAINKVAKNENIHVQAKGQDEESTVSTTSQINHNSNVQEATSISTSANTQDSNNLWSFAQVGYQLSSLASSKTKMSSHGSTKINNLKDIILLDNP